MDVADLVAAWCARDHARALVPADHEAIDATVAARTFIADQIQVEQHNGGSPRGHVDLFHGCLVLGRLLAARGASPTLASATLDGAIEAAGARGEWIASARAALAEGFVAARLEKARAEALAAWDYPRCAVRVDEEIIALAAGMPDDDQDALGDWAARVAVAAQRDGVRRAMVDGPARAALADALAFAGIEIVPAQRTRRPSLLRWFRRGRG
jgi:hypothetical protein